MRKGPRGGGRDRDRIIRHVIRKDSEDFGRVTLGIENLTNKQYILSWSQVDFYKNYFAGRGRMYSITYEYTF